MKETLKMMKSIITGKEKELTQEQLIKEYQEKKSPNILAYMFVNNFGIISNICDLYAELDEQDRASFCLQELDKCLQQFAFISKSKFITFYANCLKNELATQITHINRAKRKSYLYCEQLNEEKMDNLTTYNLHSIEDYGFTENEKMQFNLLLDGYTVKEIMNKLDKSIRKVYHTNKMIKEKILNFL